MFLQRQFLYHMEHDWSTKGKTSASLDYSRCAETPSFDNAECLYATMTRHLSTSAAQRSREGDSVTCKRTPSAPLSQAARSNVTCRTIIQEVSDSDSSDDVDDDSKSEYVMYSPGNTPSPPVPAPRGHRTSSTTDQSPGDERLLRPRIHSAGGFSDEFSKKRTQLMSELTQRCSAINDTSRTVTNATTISSNRSSSVSPVKTPVPVKSSYTVADTASHHLASPVADDNDASYHRRSIADYPTRCSTVLNPSGQISINNKGTAMSLLDKEGTVQCRHSRENGKLVPRQEWTDVYLMLTGAILSFYKNEAVTRKPDGSYNMPDTSIVLQGATVQLKGREENTFDIILITTATNTQYFIQTSDISETHSWCHHLKHNIAVLLAERTARMQHAKPVSTFSTSSSPPEAPAKTRGILTYVEAEMNRIAQLLREMLSRRPSREDLLRRGIYKEPMFGSSLADVCANDHSKIPLFLVNCFRQIEQTGLDTPGVYRHSGSVSKIQKLRIQANQGDYDVDGYDVHVLTGAVRLFFRELSRPLIAFSLLDQFVAAYGINNEQARLSEFITLINQLPEPHHDTLAELLIHLERVSENSINNQMTPHNLAIVFGPTLMWSDSPNPHDMSTAVVQQSKLVEFFILNRSRLFNTVSTRL